MLKKIKPHIGKISIILIAVTVALVAADLVTKYLEEKYYWNFTIIPGFAEIHGGIDHRNPGCAFSLLADNPEIGQPILITFTFILLAVIIFGFIILPEKFVLLKVAASLIIAGAVGNLVDRLMFFEVRDWFGLWMFGMTYCNLADFWIVIGTAIAVIDLLFLNEWAVFPLTKKAKAAQADRKAHESAEQEQKDKSETLQTAESDAVDSGVKDDEENN